VRGFLFAKNEKIGLAISKMIIERLVATSPRIQMATVTPQCKLSFQFPTANTGNYSLLRIFKPNEFVKRNRLT